MVDHLDPSKRMSQLDELTQRFESSFKGDLLKMMMMAAADDDDARLNSRQMPE